MSFVLLIMAFSLPTCKEALLTAPDKATLIVTVNPPSIPLGGQAMVRVLGYKASGTPLPDGAKIFFAANIGAIEPMKETLNGLAEALFQSNDNRSGTATITVTSGKAEVTPDPVTITIGAAALESLVLSADPTVLPPGGGFSTIRVTAYDEALNTLPNITVILSTDAGELNSKGNPLTTDAGGKVEDLLNTHTAAQVTAACGDVAASITVTVETNQPPIASFVYSPTGPGVEETVYFNASASSDPDGNIVSYEWDFGDGGAGTGQKSEHRYNKAGAYAVVLAVRDNSGNRGVDSQTVTVQGGSNPTASFEYSPANPVVNQDIYFNASASSDPDGTIQSYSWNLGDGDVASGRTISHRYAGAGQYTVLLVVTDNSGNTGTTDKQITVTRGQAPTARFSYSPQNPISGDTVYFNSTQSSDPDGVITSWQWNFGDGGRGVGENPAHRYQEAGDYVATLTVTDNDGNEGYTSQEITVKDNREPTATLEFSPAVPKVGDTVFFDGSGSTDTDGAIVSWQWNFGDDVTGGGKTVTHQYASAGTYTVVLTVTDNRGAVDSAGKIITVIE
ncbi:MAG: PKD domain-containing protein [Candidatus Aminicenantes bacterium]|nr:PKD domain-containing protein [Candidatus Aminicenantes bacterium]